MALTPGKFNVDNFFDGCVFIWKSVFNVYFTRLWFQMRIDLDGKNNSNIVVVVDFI